MGKTMLKRRAIRTSKQMIESSYVWCERFKHHRKWVSHAKCETCNKAKGCSGYKDFQYKGVIK
jgi:hypothetical protein